MKNKILMWYQEDLRIYDNPALDYAHTLNGDIIPVYILDNTNVDKIGSASRVWLHYSLNSLDISLNNTLNYFIGNPIDVIISLIKKYNITHVVWNRRYQPHQIQRDTHIKTTLNKMLVHVMSFNSALLWEPWEVLKSDKTPYKIFTPFYHKGCQNATLPRIPTHNSPNLKLFKRCDGDSNSNVKLDELRLLPVKPMWHKEMVKSWDISENGANMLLNEFIMNKINQYKHNRDYPSIDGTSKLGSYLHFGQISPHQIYYKIKPLRSNESIECYLSELGWREFAYNLLYHNPDMDKKNLNVKFDKFIWSDDMKLFESWKSGKTGIPIIDAGMRELWQTGYMHNRVRMLVGSFLTKNLLINWQYGAKWFYDALFDANLANNSAAWQWVAGSGTDAAPYFRIFNPVLQSEKFDPEGAYIRRFVPEIAKLPNKYLFNPSGAPEETLKECGITLGVEYPHPIIDINTSRIRALNHYKNI